MNTWNILYRGSLSSCNYECGYCPFAKTSNTPAELQQDERELERFIAWVSAQTEHRLGILITPWGEALVHRYYRQAMAALSHLPQVYRISVQTNLSAPVVDFATANRKTLALWATYHPGQTTLEQFLARCRELDDLGIRYSVGVVGLREHFEAIDKLRQSLPPGVYLWVNAVKEGRPYYQPGDYERLSAADPYFHWNLPDYLSGGKPCRAGETTFAVDGDGHVRRCHFIKEIIGNIYAADFETCLKPRPCTAATCGCHIGYIHQPDLKLETLYGAGLLERIPAGWPEIHQEFVARENSGISHV